MQNRISHRYRILLLIVKSLMRPFAHPLKSTYQTAITETIFSTRIILK